MKPVLLKPARGDVRHTWIGSTTRCAARHTWISNTPRWIDIAYSVINVFYCFVFADNRLDPMLLDSSLLQQIQFAARSLFYYSKMFFFVLLQNFDIINSLFSCIHFLKCIKKSLNTNLHIFGLSASVKKLGSLFEHFTSFVNTYFDKKKNNYFNFSWLLTMINKNLFCQSMFFIIQNIENS